MDWMRRQDVKEEAQEAPSVLTPEDDDECYFEEDVSVDEGMVRVILRYELVCIPCKIFLLSIRRDLYAL